MLHLTLWSLTIFLGGAQASAGGLEGLAKANVAAYQELKKLPMNATASQKQAAVDKHFRPAYRAYFEANRSTWQKLKQFAKNALFSKEDADDLKSGAKAGAPGEDSEKGAGGAPAAKKAAPTRNVSTGESEGADGAKAVGFGGKREAPKPKVVDGIIME